MLLGKRRALAEARHIGLGHTPTRRRCSFFILMRIGDRAFGKNSVGFDARRKDIESADAGWCGWHLSIRSRRISGTLAPSNSTLHRHHHRRTAAGVQGFNNMLRKAQLFVAGRVHEVAGDVGIPRRR